MVVGLAAMLVIQIILISTVKGQANDGTPDVLEVDPSTAPMPADTPLVEAIKEVLTPVVW